MRYIALLTLALVIGILISGCAKPQTYGNFAKAESVELVQDTLTVLLLNYPPAKTRLNLMQAAEDSFGTGLVEAMRMNGYAVHEYVEPSVKDKYSPLTDKPDGLPFAYIIDRMGKTGEMRVTLHIGMETIGRFYLVQSVDGMETYLPNGVWVRKQ